MAAAKSMASQATKDGQRVGMVMATTGASGSGASPTPSSPSSPSSSAPSSPSSNDGGSNDGGDRPASPAPSRSSSSAPDSSRRRDARMAAASKQRVSGKETPVWGFRYQARSCSPGDGSMAPRPSSP